MSEAFPISSANARKLLDADLANIARRLKGGQTLTRAQRELLEESEKGEVHRVGTFKKLAELLGVSRHTVGRWSNLEGAPKPASNGEHDVEAWRAFQSEIGGKGALGEESELEAEIEGLPKESILRRRRIALFCAEKEFALSLKRNELIDGELVRATWEKKRSAAAEMLKRLLSKKLAQSLSKMEGHEIHESLAGVVDESISSLVAGKFIETG